VTNDGELLWEDKLVGVLAIWKLSAPRANLHQRRHKEKSGQITPTRHTAEGILKLDTPPKAF
jgi:hypothetical protein